MMKRALIIVNPQAGRGRGALRAPGLKRALTGLGYGAEVVRTAAPGDATAFARLAKGCDLVLAIGGDGTLHEVAGGLMEISEDARPGVGILPVGSGNDYVKTLGGPRNEAALLDLIRGARFKRVDVGSANGEYFINNIGVGLDAVSTAEARRMKALTRSAAYVAGLFSALRRYDPPELAITLDDGTRRGRYLSVTVGIGRVCGGGFYLTPDALPNDGLFDVSMIRAIGLFRMLLHFPAVKAGRHRGLPFVEMATTRSLRIAGPAPLLLHADGEVREAASGEIAVQGYPGALRMLAP